MRVLNDKTEKEASDKDKENPEKIEPEKEKTNPKIIKDKEVEILTTLMRSKENLKGILDCLQIRLNKTYRKISQKWNKNTKSQKEVIRFYDMIFPKCLEESYLDFISNEQL